MLIAEGERGATGVVDGGLPTILGRLPKLLVICDVLSNVGATTVSIQIKRYVITCTTWYFDYC